MHLATATARKHFRLAGWLGAALGLAWLLCLAGAASGAELEAAQSQEVAQSRPAWWMALMRAFFDDIDWDTIDKARLQVDKFVRKVSRLVRSLRPGPGGGAGQDRMLPGWSGWWPKRQQGLFGGPSSADPTDALGVKSMLERVACFIGYMRIMNQSNEALAELDAAKTVSALFGSGGAAKNSSGFIAGLFSG